MVQYVVAAASGDTDAMAKLYSKTLKSSFFLASKLTGSEAEAVEITKKAYARAFCSIEKLKKPEAFEIWMKQIIASIYKDGAKFIFADADGNAQEPASDFLPESVLSDEEQAAKVVGAIAKLTPERRTAIMLHYNNGMPANVLSKFLGVSESTANAVLARAREDILANSGVSTPEFPELASLPVLTRLFKELIDKTGFSSDIVREIFVFAIEAYAEAKPKDVIPESAPAAEDISSEDKTKEAVEETAEEASEEAAAESEEESAEQEEPEAEEPAEEEETAEEESGEIEEDIEAESAAEEEKPEEVDEVKAEMEENILSFKSRISSMLGVDMSEKPAEEVAEEAEVISEEIKEETEEVPVQEPATEETEKEETAEAVEAAPVDEDAFEQIKRSIEGFSEIAQPEISVPDAADEGAVSFADFAGGEQFVKEEPEAVAPVEETKPVKAEKKAAKKSVKINPKFIIAAVAVLVVIIVAVVLIVKGGGKKDEAPTTTTPVVQMANEPVEWVALPALSDYEGIEFLNESFNSFKDPDTGKYGLIDYQGNVVLEAEYDGFKRCSSGRYYGEGSLNDSGYHIVAVDGSDEYEVVMMSGFASLSNEKHTDHATSNDSSLNGGDYDERDRYYEGYAAVRKNGKWGYVAQNSGKLVVPYEFEAVNNIPADDPAAAYDYCRGSAGGYVPVKKDGKMGIIKIEQDAYKIVVDFTYDIICQGKGGSFLANNGTEWGNIVIGGKSATTPEKETTTLTPATTAPTEVSIGSYVVNSDETNIRTSPDSENDDNVITELNEGYKIEALEIKEGSTGSDWVRFDYNGKEAWISMKKLDKAE